jgi:GNAT superfamily N-acetyltransferase
MEQPSQEACLLAFDIMDRYGRLKPEFKARPIKKGSGIWSSELDNDDILLIESLKVDKQYRRLGQASKLVKAMLEKTREKTRGFVAIARPDILTSEVRCEPSGEEVSNKESLESATRDGHLRTQMETLYCTLLQPKSNPKVPNGS